MLVILKFINFIILMFPFIFAGALLTLMERKVMAGIQRRKGPNVVGLYGLLQPIADGLKMIWKETIIPQYANGILFVFAPWWLLFLSLVLLSLLPLSFKMVIIDIEYSLMLIFVISSLGVYGLIFAGWASNSKYAFLGAIRAAAQMISYEVPFGLVIIILVLGAGTLNLISVVNLQKDTILFLYAPEAAIIFIVTILAETNRPPFDLPEAEGELVSGYNVEYSSMGFVCFFLSEYINMIILSILFANLFLGGNIFFYNDLWEGIPIFCILKGLLIMLMFIWVRASLPRYRYDHLMSLGWKTLLPITVGVLLFNSGIALGGKVILYGSFLG